MFTFNISHHYHGLSEMQFNQLVAQFEEVRGDLRKVIHKENQIIMADQTIEALLSKIDIATTQSGQVIAEQSRTLQTISDEQDALLLAIQNGSVTPAQLARLQVLADAQTTIATNLTAQSEFSKAVAAKGAANPVPVPVPVPAPIVLPAP